jgi:hypothetical protein
LEINKNSIVNIFIVGLMTIVILLCRGNQAQAAGLGGDVAVPDTVPVNAETNGIR